MSNANASGLKQNKTIDSESAPSIRRRHNWVHVWVGLLVGWLLYVIFFSGTLSFFKEELRFWAWPSAHFSQQTNESVKAAGDYLEKVSPNAIHWTIDLPSERSPLAFIHWYNPGEKIKKGGGHRIWLDTVSGETRTPEDSRLFDIVYRMHLELQGLPGRTGRMVTGAIALLLLVTLVSGVITHKKIFTNFFTFKKNKGVRSWQDLHNVTAVVTLPFYLIVSIGGFLLVMYSIMPWGVLSAFDGKFRDFRQASVGKQGVVEYITPSGAVPFIDLSKPKGEHLQQLVDRASQNWPQGASKIEGVKIGSKKARIEIRQSGAESLLNRARGERWTFNGNTGDLISASKSITPESEAHR